MDKSKVVELKRKIAGIAQEICNEIDGKEVSFFIDTVTRSNVLGEKATLVSDVRIQMNEEV